MNIYNLFLYIYCIFSGHKFLMKINTHKIIFPYETKTTKIEITRRRYEYKRFIRKLIKYKKLKQRILYLVTRKEMSNSSLLTK
jgi:hypothetical protein